MFPTLEYYISKPKEIIESEYDNIIKKPGFSTDFDPLLMVIVHDFIMDQSILNDLEVKMVAIIIKLRQAKSYIYFTQFFMAMKEEVMNYSITSREIDTEKITSIFNRSSLVSTPENIDLSGVINTTPHFKNTVMCDYASPKSGERYSFSDDLNEVPLHFTTCSSPSSSYIPITTIYQYQNPLQNLTSGMI